MLLKSLPMSNSMRGLRNGQRTRLTPKRHTTSDRSLKVSASSCIGEFPSSRALHQTSSPLQQQRRPLCDGSLAATGAAPLIPAVAASASTTLPTTPPLTSKRNNIVMLQFVYLSSRERETKWLRSVDGIRKGNGAPKVILRKARIIICGGKEKNKGVRTKHRVEQGTYVQVRGLERENVFVYIS